MLLMNTTPSVAAAAVDASNPPVPFCSDALDDMFGHRYIGNTEEKEEEI
jgi:hypothetical protein